MWAWERRRGSERVSARCVAGVDGWGAGVVRVHLVVGLPDARWWRGQGGPAGAFCCWSGATTCMTWFGSGRAGRGVSGVNSDVEITSVMARGQPKHGDCKLAQR